METVGKITDMSLNVLNSHLRLTLELEEQFTDEVQKLAQKEKLSIKLTTYRKGRSLNANSYFHVLVGKLARAQQPPISEGLMKNHLIAQYGASEYINGNIVTYLLAEEFEDALLKRTDVHPVVHGRTTVNGKRMIEFELKKHTRDYDTKEMSVLLDGTIEECKELGIETLTPNQIAEMKEVWGIEVDNTKQ